MGSLHNILIEVTTAILYQEKKMKTLILIFVLCVCSVFGLPRSKRDLTCASWGHDSCSLSCRLRGQASGSDERRGVLCNVGGPNTCNYSCKSRGHTGGTCQEDFTCKCSGENSRWGAILQNIGSRL